METVGNLLTPGHHSSMGPSCQLCRGPRCLAVSSFFSCCISHAAASKPPLTPKVFVCSALRSRVTTLGLGQQPWVLHEACGLPVQGERMDQDPEAGRAVTGLLGHPVASWPPGMTSCGSRTLETQDAEIFCVSLCISLCVPRCLSPFLCFISVCVTVSLCSSSFMHLFPSLALSTLLTSLCLSLDLSLYRTFHLS